MYVALRGGRKNVFYLNESDMGENQRKESLYISVTGCV